MIRFCLLILIATQNVIIRSFSWISGKVLQCQKIWSFYIEMNHTCSGQSVPWFVSFVRLVYHHYK